MKNEIPFTFKVSPFSSNVCGILGVVTFLLLFPSIFYGNKMLDDLIDQLGYFLFCILFGCIVSFYLCWYSNKRGEFSWGGPKFKIPIYLMTFFLFWFLISFGIDSLITIINVRWDVSKPYSRWVTVVNKELYTDKGNIYTYLTIVPDIEKKRTKRLEVNKYLYDRVNIGHQDLLLTTKAGYLGYQWIIGMQPRVN